MTSHEHPPRPDEERRGFAEEAESLWRLTLAPVIWALHFVTCYATVALACAQPFLSIGILRPVLLVATLPVLGVIVWEGRRALRQWRPDGQIHDEGKPEDRHRFLGHATFLLAVISGIGTVFTSVPLIMLEGCQ